MNNDSKKSVEHNKTRQTKKEKEKERILAMSLFQKGCTKNAICSALKLTPRKLAQHFTDTAFSPEGLPTQSGTICITCGDDLPSDIRTFLNAGEGLLVEIETEESNKREGFFRVMTIEEIKKHFS